MLYNVLKAYAVMDQSLGYCQSMSYITAILLLHLEEEVSPTLPSLSFFLMNLLILLLLC